MDSGPGGNSVDGIPAIRAAIVDRAASDLHADFERQNGRLTQAQFDRLVLRRNLSPPEMVAVIAKLNSLGVSITDSDLPGRVNRGTVSPSPHEVAPVPSQQLADLLRRGAPYSLLTRSDEVRFGRSIQLALRIQPGLDPSKVTSAEEKSLVERGVAARDRMVGSNLGLIRFALQNLRRPTRSLETADLFQEGVIGLMRAVEKFDPELGLKFSTYAMWWIRQSILRGLDDKDRTIRIPVHRLESINRMKRLRRRLAIELGREPAVHELAEGLRWTLEKTLFIQWLCTLDCVSLESPLGEDDGMTVGDLIASREPSPYDLTRQRERSVLINEFLDRLTPRQRLIVERRFGLGTARKEHTLQHVGDELGVTRERIRQIEAVALRRLHRWVTRRLHDALM